MTRRVLQLTIGLVLYGVGCALTVEAGLGLDPWTVLAQGLSLRTGIGIGWMTNLLGLFVLLLWIPLRQKPGVGTLANIAVVGTSIQATLAVVTAPTDLVTRFALLLSGIVLVAVASGLYIGAHFGPGPRDGLMTGMHTRLGWPIWSCRLVVEATVLIGGWLLGGTVGIGTVLFALLIGPLVHLALPLLDTRRSRPTRRAVRTRAHPARAGDPRPGWARPGGPRPAGVSALGTSASPLPAPGASAGRSWPPPSTDTFPKTNPPRPS